MKLATCVIVEVVIMCLPLDSFFFTKMDNYYINTVYLPSRMHLPGYISLLNPYNILQIFITYRLTISHTFCQNHLDPLINDWYNKITFGNVWVFPWTHFRFAKCQECHLGCFTNFNMYFKEERVNYHDHLVQTSLERTHYLFTYRK